MTLYAAFQQAAVGQRIVAPSRASMRKVSDTQGVLFGGNGEKMGLVTPVGTGNANELSLQATMIDLLSNDNWMTSDKLVKVFFFRKSYIGSQTARYCYFAFYSALDVSGEYSFSVEYRTAQGASWTTSSAAVETQAGGMFFTTLPDETLEVRIVVYNPSKPQLRFASEPYVPLSEADDFYIFSFNHGGLTGMDYKMAVTATDRPIYFNALGIEAATTVQFVCTQNYQVVSETENMSSFMENPPTSTPYMRGGYTFPDPQKWVGKTGFLFMRRGNDACFIHSDYILTNHDAA